MNCKEIQDLLIMSDEDEGFPEIYRSQAELHVSQCESCGSFQEVLIRVRTSFRESAEIQPPPIVWERIQASLKAGKKSQAKKVGYRARLEKFARRFGQAVTRFPLSLPRPLVGAVASVVILAVVVTLPSSPQNWGTTRDYLGEQLLYLADLDLTEDDAWEGDEGLLGAGWDVFLMG